MCKDVSYSASFNDDDEEDDDDRSDIDVSISNSFNVFNL